MAINCKTGTPPAAFLHFDELPDSAFVQLETMAWLFDCSSAAIWRWSKIGRLPKPAAVGPQLRAWNVGEIRRVMKEMAADDAAA